MEPFHYSHGGGGSTYNHTTDTISVHEPKEHNSTSYLDVTSNLDATSTTNQQHHTSPTAGGGGGCYEQPTSSTSNTSSHFVLSTAASDPWSTQQSLSYPSHQYYSPFYHHDMTPLSAGGEADPINPPSLYSNNQNLPAYDDNIYYPSPTTSGFVGPAHNESNETRPVVTLENKGLWNDFYQVGTEMIITKTGR